MAATYVVLDLREQPAPVPIISEKESMGAVLNQSSGIFLHRYHQQDLIGAMWLRPPHGGLVSTHAKWDF